MARLLRFFFSFTRLLNSILFFLAVLVLLTTEKSSALYGEMLDGTSITLHWTAPGDDGNVGTASVYEIRCSTKDVGADTASWWAGAITCPGVSAPQKAGTAESFTITGLEPDSIYYFAIRTADEADNWSGVSNIFSTAYYSCADINSDANINLLDIVFLMNYLYRGGPKPYDIANSDVNGDGQINILDNSYLINYLYKDGPEPMCNKQN